VSKPNHCLIHNVFNQVVYAATFVSGKVIVFL